MNSLLAIDHFICHLVSCSQTHIIFGTFCLSSHIYLSLFVVGEGYTYACVTMRFIFLPSSLLLVISFVSCFSLGGNPAYLCWNVGWIMAESACEIMTILS